MMEPYDKCVNLMRTFFRVKGFMEIHSQCLSILACEDPSNIITYEYANQVYMLPQTNQLSLDNEILKNKEHIPGYFCVTTKYYNETIGGMYPQFEFECKGGIDVLIPLQDELFQFMGFHLKDIEDCEETPFHPIPFWTTKGKNLYKKVNNIEIICSSEKCCNKLDMRNRFDNLYEGTYADILYNTFGKERVEKELTTFLKHTFIHRSCGYIGIIQMIQAMKLSNLM